MANKTNNPKNEYPIRRSHIANALNVHNRTHRREDSRAPHVMAALLGAMVLAGLGVQTVEANQAPQTPTINGPQRVYTARHGDSEWSIGSRAYPNIDPRKAQELIDQQNSNDNHLIVPGQKFIFGTDAELGKVVNPKQSNSVPKG